MAEITIGVINPAETEKVTMRVPDTIPVGQLTDAMVEQMALPPRGNDGRRLRYHLNVRTEDGMLERLDNNETLQGNEVVNENVLQLTVEMTAGASLVALFFLCSGKQ